MKISAYTPAPSALNGAEILVLDQAGATYRSTAQAIARAHNLDFTVPMVVGQQDYTVNITSAGLTAAPRGAIVQFVANASTDAEFTAHMVAGTTTATSLAIHVAQVPTGTQLLAIHLIP